MIKSCFRNMLIFALICISTGGVCAGFPPSSSDFTGDGRVDISDFSIVSSWWTASLAWYPDGLLPQMLAHWALDQNAMDTQSMFDGVITGNPTWYTKKNNLDEVKIGSGAVGLAGQDYIDIDASDVPHFYHSFTLEAWIKTSFTQQTQTILSKGDTSWKIGVEAITGKPFLACWGLSGTNYLTGNTLVSDGLWHHLAGVYDSNAGLISLYLDGALNVQASASGQVGRNRLNIRIGSNPLTSGEGWRGSLDNICIYNYALTINEVFGRNTYHVNVLNGNDAGGTDPEWGKGKLKAFKTIQHAIDVAQDGDIILVWPGVYRESLFFMGKAITVRSAADAAILEPDPADADRIAVTFMYAEQHDSVFEHFVILNSDVAFWIHQSSPTLRHLTIVNNNCGIDSILNSLPVIENSIFWNNIVSDITYDNTYAPTVTYSCIQRPYPGQGNFSSDPLFVNPDTSDPNTMDFHLRSEYGRYLSDGNSLQHPLPENWVTDEDTSPCIDAGRPDINPFCETMCNGGRINLGAYGNTPFAAQSPWSLRADIDHNGRVYLEDVLLFSQQWLMTSSQ